MKLRNLLVRFIPQRERNFVIRELDDLASRPSAAGRRFWYHRQLIQFALRLRAEQLLRLPLQIVPIFADLRYASRRLFRRPAYFLAAAATLGVGIGGTVTVYAAAHWVLLRDVPGVGEPDDLVLLRLESTENWGSNVTWGISHPDFQLVRERLTSFDDMLATASRDVHIRVAGDALAERVAAQLVTPNFFELLRINPVAGRFFSPGEHAGETGPANVVVSHAFALRHWAQPDRAVGQTLSVNGQSYQVTGVAPPGFKGAELPGLAELWLPSTSAPNVFPRQDEILTNTRTQFWTQLIGRRVAGVPLTQITFEANAAMGHVRATRGSTPHSFMATHFLFRPYEGIGLDPWVRDDVTRTLTILGAVATLLLMLTAANVANLGIARAASRRTEQAIRRALGAGRWRVAREPLLEGLIVGWGGAIVGTLTGLGAERVVGEARLAARGASLEGMQIDLPVLVFCGLVAITAGILSAVAPAFVSRPGAASTTLAEHRQGTSMRRGLSRTLVVAQVAVSTVLIVLAGLFSRTVINLQNIELGFDPQNAVTFSIDPGLNGYDDARTRTLLAGIQNALPGVAGYRAGGVMFPAPLEARYFTAAAMRPDASDDDRIVGAGFGISGTGTLDALGIRVVAGRPVRVDFASQSGPTEIMINESMGRALFPGSPPAAIPGRSILFGFPGDAAVIAGVVADARIIAPQAEPQPVILYPYSSELAEGRATFFLATNRPPAEVINEVRQIANSIDSELPLFDMGTGGDKVRTLMTAQRVLARLAVLLSLFGLILAAVGLYGVLAYTVTDRTHELGIRSALGADANKLRASVMWSGFGVTALGLVVALPIVYLAGRGIASRLYGVSPIDPLTITAGIGLLAAVTSLASWIPAARATRISPLEALRIN